MSDRLISYPSIQEVHQWGQNVVVELINNYAVNSVYFNDFFYYKTPRRRLQDDIAYR